MPRLGLLAGLVALAVFGVLRAHDPHGSAAGVVGNLGLGLVVGFIVLSMVAYQRVIYRVRRHDPGAWRPTPRFMGQLMGAPLGIGNPQATAYDRAVLWLTAAVAMALLPLSFLSH